MTIIWIFVAVLLLALEAVTVQLVSIWFAVGAVLATIPAQLGASFPIQMLIFVLGSIITLVIGRPLIRKKLTVKNPEKTNLDATVGKTAVVVQTIEPNSSKGRVFVDGLSWQAKSKENNFIQEGSKVVIERIVGVTAVVSIEDQ